MEKVQKYFDYVLPLVKYSGQLLLEAHSKDLEISIKTPWDLVTKYDVLVENILIEKIKEKYPDHKFIGEESHDKSTENPILTNDPTWFIDPIDGTTNFTRKIPMCGISLGLCVAKEQVLGIIFNPFLNELFTAIRGQGAFLNGKSIKTSGVEEINRSIFCYEISLASTSDYLHALYMSRTSHLVKNVMGMRIFGSPVVSLCYVACGKIDAYQCDGLYPWDAAAGTLIVREAGGCVMDTAGKEEFDLMNPNFLATSTKELSRQYLEVEKIADQEMKQKYPEFN